MPSLQDIEQTLPSGFHDAHVRTCILGFADCVVSFELDLSVGNPDASDPTERDRYRAATLRLDGVVACEIEPRVPSGAALPNVPLWIDLVQHNGDLLAGRDLPPDVFRASFFVQNWNASVVIAARNAELSWVTPSAR
jgi:hypothetical protein